MKERFFSAPGNLNIEQAEEVVNSTFEKGRLMAVEAYGLEGLIAREDRTHLGFVTYSLRSYMNPLLFPEANKNRMCIFVIGEIEYRPNVNSSRFMDAEITVTLGLDTGY